MVSYNPKPQAAVAVVAPGQHAMQTGGYQLHYWPGASATWHVVEKHGESKDPFAILNSLSGRDATFTYPPSFRCVHQAADQLGRSPCWLGSA